MKRNLKLANLSLVILLTFLNTAKANKETIFKGKTSIEKPFELRDPFVAPKMKRNKKVKLASQKSSTVFDDTPSIENAKVEDITITGVIIGKDRRAFAKIRGIERIIALKEGMSIGENSAELKAILAGGIILVEKTINIYGEEEYLETVLPISN